MNTYNPKTLLLWLILTLGISTCLCAQNSNDSLENRLKIAPEDTTKVLLLGKLTTQFTSVDPSKAEDYALQALRLSRKLDYEYGIAMALDMIGVLRYELGEMDSALYFYLEALKIFEQTNDNYHICPVLDKIGQVYTTTNDYPAAKTYYDKALTLSQEIGDNRLLGNSYNGVGSFHINYAEWYEGNDNSELSREEYNKSVPFLLQAANYFDKADYGKGRALIYGNLSFVKSALNEYDSALLYAEKALDYFKKYNLLNYLTLSYNQLCAIYMHQKMYDKALIAASTSLEINDQVENKYDRLNTYDNLVTIHKALGNYKDALSYSTKFIALYKEVSSREQETQLAIIQGKYNTEKQEQENLLLKKEAELNQATIKKQNIFAGIVVGIVLVLGIISLLNYRNLIAKKKFAAQIENLNAAQSRWFTNIAHELRTPLTMVIGPISNLLKKDKSLSEEAKSDIELANRQGEQLLKLVNEILDVSRMEVGQLKLKSRPTEMSEMIRQIAASFHSFAAQKQVSLEVECHQHVYVSVDPDKISNILINLTSNALKFTQSGGCVTLILEKDDAHIKISVKDTGEGIPEKELPHVFDRFFQVQKPGRSTLGGSGIGLALSLELAKLHGGTITVTSKENEGSIFTLLLPVNLVVDSPVPLGDIGIEGIENLKPEEQEVTPTQNKNHKPKVMLVEDNPDMRAYVLGYLREHYDVTQAVDGQDALEKIETQLPDLIISDVMMPRLDGIELARRIKNDERYKTIPFITLTARADERDKVDALRLGIDDYLLKPFNPEELLARAFNLIQNYLERKQVSVEDTAEPILTHAEKLIKELEQKVLESLQDGNFSVKELALHAAMSESTLNRTIKKSTGMSPGQFIREIRLQKAISLLESKQYATIAEVVMAVGLENNAHFSSLFKKRFGKSPSAYV